jgi:hypothetical protein
MKRVKVAFAALALVLGIGSAITTKAMTQAITYSVWNGSTYAVFTGTPDPSNCDGSSAQTCILEHINGVTINIAEGVYQF